MMNKIFYTFIFCLFSFCSIAAELNISLNKKVLSEGDVLYLTIDYTGEDTAKPDLSSLQQDFKIVSNSTSKAVNIINGTITQSQKWTLGLKPLKTGKIVIKPIKLGNLISNYAEVDVKEMTNIAYVPDSRENSNSPYFEIEHSFTPENPYIQQQVNYFITLYDSIGLQNGSISFDDASLKDWVITPLSEKPTVRQDVINGKKMNILTYAFAAFPQKSGNLLLPQVFFDGYYIKNTSFDFPDFTDGLLAFGINLRNAFGQHIPVKMKTSSETVTIKGVPDKNIYWLPLKNLNISADWSSSVFKEGEAINRKITITATGTQAAQMPSLTFSDIKDIKQYPEKPIVSENIVNGQIVVSQIVNNVYIPTKAGIFTLPAIEIPWFNVNTNTYEKAVLPEETITVKTGNSFFNDTSTPIKTNNTEETTTPLETETTSKKLDIPSIPKKYVFLALCFVGFLLLMFIFRHFSKKNIRKQLKTEIISAINHSDYKKAKFLILKWAQHVFKQDTITNFDIITSIINNQDFAQQLSLLNALLYSQTDYSFDRTKFIEVFKKADKMVKTVNVKKDILPKLYD